MEVLLGTDFALPIHVAAAAKSLSMLWVSPGTFRMGEEADEPDYEYQPPFEASLTRGYWLGQYPVTQAQWLAVMGNNPSQFPYDSDRPVESISWYDAIQFCKTVEQSHHIEPPEGYHFSPPTEAQWEYAGRAGTRLKHQIGDDIVALQRVAWFKNNSGDITHPVGQKEPNVWGFYDMLGNVGEWCFDALDDYPTQSTADWVGRRNPSLRVVRGGAWGTPGDSKSMDIGFRWYPPAEERRAWFGLRLCLRYTESQDLKELSAN